MKKHALLISTFGRNNLNYYNLKTHVIRTNFKSPWGFELHEFNCVTQKILTENIINWQELITEILNFHHTFSVRKTTTQLFQYFRISTKNYISGIFWVFKSKLQINPLATYIALFLPDSNNCFFICLVPYIHISLYYFLNLCFYFHLFHTLLTTGHSTI